MAAESERGIRADGRNQQPNTATIELDLTRGLSIGGSQRLRRASYFNIHGTPGEFSSAELDWLVGDLRASFGRSMGAISSFMRGLAEDPSRPGYAEPHALKRNAATSGKQRSKKYQSRATKAGIINSVHPESYYGNPKVRGKSNANFIHASPEASSEILSEYFSATDVEQEPIFEVANECNVKARELETSFQDMCDLHSVVARRLHRDVPGLKVGGPTSAWPAFEVGNFRIWHEQMGLFIDRAGKDMDFLSVHLYTTHWDDKTVNRFGANVDAILDLMESQSLLSAGEVKPLLISECGTGLRKGERIMKEYSPYRDWLILRGANHIFMNLLRRDDRILKMVPFIVAKATWFKEEHPYPWVLFHKKDKQWVPTHLAKWYEFWKDVDGHHLPTTCSSLDVQTHALLSKQTVYLLVDNLVDSNVHARLGAVLPDGVKVVSTSMSRLYYDGEQPRLDANQPITGDWRHVDLGPHESCIIRIELNSSPKLENTIVETTHYADRTVQPIAAKPTYFRVAGPEKDAIVASATLRIGFGRNVALSKEPKVLINGVKLSVPGDERGECTLQGDMLFTTKEIAVPKEALRKANRVSIQFPQAGGHISSVVLVAREEQRAAGAEVAAAAQASSDVQAFE